MGQAVQLSRAELERYLHRHIPLSGAMGATVLSAGLEEVVLAAPLAPNINHRDTVFGGSAAALAMLAAWSLLYVRLRAEGSAARLVIQRHAMEYRRPVAGDFTARAHLKEPERCAQFAAMLARRGKARIAVTAFVEYGGEVAATFEGEFVALRGAER